jgi:hypothetical protein
VGAADVGGGEDAEELFFIHTVLDITLRTFGVFALVHHALLSSPLPRIVILSEVWRTARNEPKDLR